jgi:hypothetical protein
VRSADGGKATEAIHSPHNRTLEILFYKIPMPIDKLYCVSAAMSMDLNSCLTMGTEACLHWLNFFKEIILVKQI